MKLRSVHRSHKNERVQSQHCVDVCVCVMYVNAVDVCVCYVCECCRCVCVLCMFAHKFVAGKCMSLWIWPAYVCVCVCVCVRWPKWLFLSPCLHRISLHKM